MDLRIGILASRENYIVSDILEKFKDFVGAVICKSCKDNEIIGAFEKGDVNLIILAGYTRRVSDHIIARYPGRILNIHPSLLPKFGGKGMYGLAIHEAVIASKEKKSGVTIHIVEGDYDVGRIIAQKDIDISGYNIGDLQDKISIVEKSLICDVLNDIRDEKLEWVNL